jgi:hypothetical protein
MAISQIELSKYMFSSQFATKIHEFSEKHYKEGLSEFRKSWSEWMKSPEIMAFIQNEITALRTKGYTGDPAEIYKKIHISARFYYRKKTKLADRKKNTQNETKTKAYIGLSTEFIACIDNYIKCELLNEDSKKYINDAVIVKINQKNVFVRFIREHTNNIHKELGILNEKYRKHQYEFIPLAIADKFKKAFQNRFHIIRHSICK